MPPILFQHGPLTLTPTAVQLGSERYELAEVQTVSLNNPFSRAAARLLFIALIIGLVCCALSGWKLAVAIALAILCLVGAYGLGKKSLWVLSMTVKGVNRPLLNTPDRALAMNLKDTLDRALVQQNCS